MAGYCERCDTHATDADLQRTHCQCWAFGHLVDTDRDDLDRPDDWQTGQDRYERWLYGDV